MKCKLLLLYRNEELVSKLKDLDLNFLGLYIFRIVKWKLDAK